MPQSPHEFTGKQNPVQQANRDDTAVLSQWVVGVRLGRTGSWRWVTS